MSPSKTEKTIASTYLIKRENPDRWNGCFEHIATVRTSLSPFRNERLFFHWLMTVTGRLNPKKRLKIGDHVFIVRTQAKNEDVGYHMICRGRITPGGFIVYDRCDGSAGHKGKAIPGRSWGDQPYWQRQPATSRFMPFPPSAKAPFYPKFRKDRTFFNHRD